jgi:hypothetical protein
MDFCPQGKGMHEGLKLHIGCNKPRDGRREVRDGKGGEGVRDFTERP